jgi:hypothetical protein
MICMKLANDSEMEMKDRRLDAWRNRACIAAAALATFAMPSAHASLFKGETLDSVANGLAWFILIVMPVVGIALFWIVHVLPEKIAERRHHPNKDAIHVLCLLSLVFGGLLWPIAWLWAYTRPLGHKLAYGTEKHEDYFIEQGKLAASGELAAEHLEQLRAELEHLKERGQLTPDLQRVYVRLKTVGEPPAVIEGTGVR